MIERFILLTHSRTSDVSRVADARKQLFAQPYFSLENIPTTEAALEQYINAGICVYLPIHNFQILLTRDGQIKGLDRVTTILAWATLPEATKSVLVTDALWL